MSGSSIKLQLGCKTLNLIVWGEKKAKLPAGFALYLPDEGLIGLMVVEMILLVLLVWVNYQAGGKGGRVACCLDQKENRQVPPVL